MADSLDRLTTALADRYAIEYELGAGGMATVYLAEDLKHHRKVAVKVLRPDLVAALGPERFLREIEISANLNHPHILPLFDSGAAEGCLYYVMPYVEGESLRSKLSREKQLPIDYALEITQSVALALDYAHRQNVIHRDIKPENILLHEGQAMVADFGIALAVSLAGGERLTGTGFSLGTPAYMSPEQVAGDRQLDARSDVYSLGCLAYEMLVGDPPHTGSTTQAIIAKILGERPSSIRLIRSNVPSHVETAVLRALAKVPADRFSSAEQFAEALRLSGRTQPPEARAGVASPNSRLRRRLAVLGVAGIVAFGVAAVLLSRADGPGTVAIGRTERLTHMPGLELDPAVSPDGRMIAYAAGPNGQMDIYVRQLSGGDAVNLTRDMAGQHRSPRWSPDGTQIAFLASQRTTSAVVVVPSLGGTPRSLIAESEATADIYGVTWSPDAREIAYTLADTVFVLAVSGGQPRSLATVFGPHTVRWSPGGEWIAFVSENPTFIYGTFVLGNLAPSSLWLIAPSGGEPIQLTTSEYLNTSPAWTRDGKGLFFISNRDGSRDVYHVRLTGSGRPHREPVRVTTGLDAHTLSLGPDDEQLLYSALRLNSNIWSVAVPAGGPISVSAARPVTIGSQAIEGIAVSRDGRWLAFDSNLRGNQDIYRLQLPDGKPEQLTTHPRDDFFPVWSPNGEEIAFYSFRSGNRDIFVMTADGRSLQQLTDQQTHQRVPHWSPDGRSIVFQSDETGRSELYVISRLDDGSGWDAPRQLTFDGAANPRWSPDGRHIAYVHERTLRLVSPDGGEPRILVDPRGTAMPAPWAAEWGRDSETVYYKAFDSAQQSSIWSASVSGGSPRLLVRFDDPTRQSNRNEFATDGRRFYFTVGSQESDIWAMELLRR